MISRCFWLLLLVMWCLSVRAQSIVLTDENRVTGTDLSEVLLAYHGDQPPLDLEQAEHQQAGYQASGARLLVRAGQPQWLRLVFDNHSSRERELVLDLQHALLNEVQMRVSGNGQRRDIITGLDFPYETRDYNVNSLGFRVVVPPLASTQLDFSIASQYAPIVAPKIHEARDAMRGTLQTNFFFGFIAGKVFAVGFFLLCYLVWMPRNREIICLLLFTLIGFTGVLFHSGVLSYNFPGVFVAYGEWINFLMTVGSLALLALLIQLFYRTEKKYYWVHQMLNLLLVLSVVFLALLPIVEAAVLRDVFYWVQLIFYIGSLWFCLFNLLRCRNSPIFIGIGLVLYLSLMFAHVLIVFDVLPVLLFSRFSYELSLTLMMDMLCAAVVMSMIKGERQRAETSEKIVRVQSEMQARSEVVAKITHDIKSPLTAILGAEQLLRDRSVGAVGSEQASYLDIIRASGLMVVNLVDDVLLHTEVKRGGLHWQLAPIVVRDFVSELETVAKLSHAVDQLDFNCHCADDVPTVVLGDRKRLTQVFSNLLNNAFKFTPAGFISLTVSVQELSGDGSRCILCWQVRDSGVGMSSEFIARAFDSYARETKGEAAGRPGFGLGLAICQQLVTEMGGTISIESTLGAGSIFSVRLPFALPTQ